MCRPKEEKRGRNCATGHFTQVGKIWKTVMSDEFLNLDLNLQIVWKATKKLGIGYARSPGDCQVDCKLVIVANYEPPQGMGADVKTNVVPPTAKTLSGYRSQDLNLTDSYDSKVKV